MHISRRRLLYGIAVNDASYAVTRMKSGRKQTCPFYQTWISMLTRCYSDKYHQRFPTYRGCYVCLEWHRFSRFREWMVHQEWIGMHLDKDIIGDGKCYSPDLCVFVSPRVNTFFHDGNQRRGDYPIGVRRRQNGRFEACVRAGGKNKCLGHFDSAEDAHLRWLQEKAKLAHELASEQTNEKVANALLVYAAKLELRRQPDAVASATFGNFARPNFAEAQ